MASSHLGSSTNSFSLDGTSSKVILPEQGDYGVVTLVREGGFGLGALGFGLHVVERLGVRKINCAFAMSGTFRELECWPKAFDLSLSIYNATRLFPKDDLFGLTSQLRRAAV